MLYVAAACAVIILVGYLVFLQIEVNTLGKRISGTVEQYVDANLDLGQRVREIHAGVNKRIDGLVNDVSTNHIKTSEQSKRLTAYEGELNKLHRYYVRRSEWDDLMVRIEELRAATDLIIEQREFIAGRLSEVEKRIGEGVPRETISEAINRLSESNERQIKYTVDGLRMQQIDIEGVQSELKAHVKLTSDAFKQLESVLDELNGRMRGCSVGIDDVVVGIVDINAKLETLATITDQHDAELDQLGAVALVRKADDEPVQEDDQSTAWTRREQRIQRRNERKA